MVLEIRNISKNFGGISALTDVSLTIKEGEIFGLIGPNGAGKTTMFNIITNMYAPSGGDILFRGETITGISPHKITYRGICRTFQNIKLFQQMTVLENVIVGRHSRSSAGVLSSVLRMPSQKREEEELMKKAEELLNLVGLASHMHMIAENLSYGQQRRLEIARALASDPKLLLLDEPAAGMNEKETDSLYDLIKEVQKRGVTVLIIEHDMPLVMKLCDRITVLNFGEKLAEGTPDEIQNNDSVVEAYLGTEEEEVLA